MKQCNPLVFIFTCKLAISQNINIDHGDSHKTDIHVNKYGGTMFIDTYQEHEGAIYFIENRKTGVKARYLLPIKTTKEDSTLSQNTRISADRKNIYFSYSTAKKETRQEEIKINDSGQINVKGSFSYVHPNGHEYLQGYEADENGFRTKVSFGTKIIYSYSGVRGEGAPPAKPPGGKGIDGSLLCSLGGSGCHK